MLWLYWLLTIKESIMLLSLLFILPSFSATLNIKQETPISCGFGKVTLITNNRESTCYECENCTEGSRLAYECGEKTVLYEKDLPKQCIPCNNNAGEKIEFYSPGGTSTACNKCREHCGINEVMEKPCTLDSDMRCPCKSNFYRDHETELCLYECSPCPLQNAKYLIESGCRGNPNGKECRSPFDKGKKNKKIPTVNNHTPVRSTTATTTTTITTTPHTEKKRQTTLKPSTNFKTMITMKSSRNLLTATTASSIKTLKPTTIPFPYPSTEYISTKTHDDKNNTQTTMGGELPTKAPEGQQNLPGVSIIIALLIVIIIIVVIVIGVLCGKQVRKRRYRRVDTKIKYKNIQSQKRDINKVLQKMERNLNFGNLRITALLSSSADHVLAVDDVTFRKIKKKVYTLRIIKQRYIAIPENENKQNVSQNHMEMELGIHQIITFRGLINHMKTSEITNRTLYDFLKTIRNVSGIITIVKAIEMCELQE